MNVVGWLVGLSTEIIVGLVGTEFDLPPHKPGLQSPELAQQMLWSGGRGGWWCPKGCVVGELGECDGSFPGTRDIMAVKDIKIKKWRSVEHCETPAEGCKPGIGAGRFELGDFGEIKSCILPWRTWGVGRLRKRGACKGAPRTRPCRKLALCLGRLRTCTFHRSMSCWRRLGVVEGVIGWTCGDGSCIGMGDEGPAWSVILAVCRLIFFRMLCPRRWGVRWRGKKRARWLWKHDHVGGLPGGRKVDAAKAEVEDMCGEFYGFGRKVAESSPGQRVLAGSGDFTWSDGGRRFFHLDIMKNLRWHRFWGRFCRDSGYGETNLMLQDHGRFLYYLVRKSRSCKKLQYKDL